MGQNWPAGLSWEGFQSPNLYCIVVSSYRYPFCSSLLGRLFYHIAGWFMCPKSLKQTLHFGIKYTLWQDMRHMLAFLLSKTSKLSHQCFTIVYSV
jgi:hypothetical protein